MLFVKNRPPPRYKRSNPHYPYTTHYRSLATISASAASVTETPRHSAAHLAPTRARASLLGGLSNRPRLSAPIGRASQSLSTLDIGYTVFAEPRSEERRVGKECVSTCRSRWSPSHTKKKIKS